MGLAGWWAQNRRGDGEARCDPRRGDTIGRWYQAETLSSVFVVRSLRLVSRQADDLPDLKLRRIAADQVSVEGEQFLPSGRVAELL